MTVDLIGGLIAMTISISLMYLGINVHDENYLTSAILFIVAVIGFFLYAIHIERETIRDNSIKKKVKKCASAK